MPRDGVFDESGKAYAEEGQVMLDGPDGMAISMTPDAAEETAHELIRAVSEGRKRIGGREGANPGL